MIGSVLNSVRGRPAPDLPRRTVAELLHDAGLPSDARRAIEAIVRGARLRRAERLDVALELIAHFQDGLDAGATESVMMQSFGDPEVSAPLVGRAKRRQRGPGRHVPRVIGVVLLLTLGVYGWRAARFHLAAPTIAVDYLERLDADARAVPDADRAWPLYRALLAEHGRLGMPADAATFDPRDASWDAWIAWRDEHAALLPALHAAAARSGFGYPLSFDIAPEDAAALGVDPVDDPITARYDLPRPLLTSLRLPYLTPVRHCGQLLAVELDDALRAGDVERAEAALASIEGVARQLREVPILINQLVAWSLLGDALAVVETRFESTMRSTWSDAELARVDDRLATWQPETNVDFSGERYWFHDLLQCAYTDDGSGDGHLTLDGLHLMRDLHVSTQATDAWDDPSDPDDAATTWADAFIAPGRTFIAASRAELAARYDALLDELQADVGRPPWQATSDAVTTVMQLAADPMDRVRYEPIVTCFPMMHSGSLGHWALAARRDAVRIAIALERHARAHGALPDTLDALVPTFLAAVPRDPYRDAPLRYRRSADGATWTLWSAGLNGTDDDGAASAGVTARPPRDQDDWILHAPDARDGADPDDA